MATDLRINGESIDLDGVVSMPISKQFDSISNPVAIKNEVSKTITIPATPHNNRVFGNIWRIDQITGDLFNPSKRIPFVLAHDGALVTSGYVKLTTIKKIGGLPRSYEIHLFGGLGDFFYELEQKEMRELALPNNNYQHTINAVTVKNPPDGFVYFMSYQGLYDGFNSKKMLRNGVIEEIPIERDEHQLLEFRSYYQRPAVRLSDLFRAITQNSGYDVDLSSEFFQTPYFNQTYLALSAPDKEDATVDYVAFVRGAGESGTPTPWPIGISFGNNTNKALNTTHLGEERNGGIGFINGDSAAYDTYEIKTDVTETITRLDFDIAYKVGVYGHAYIVRHRYLFMSNYTQQNLVVGVEFYNAENGDYIDRRTRTHPSDSFGLDFGNTSPGQKRGWVLRDDRAWGKDEQHLIGSVGIPAGVRRVGMRFYVNVPQQKWDNYNGIRLTSLADGEDFFYADYLQCAIDYTKSLITLKSTDTVRSDSSVNYSTFIPSGISQLSFLKNFTKAFGLLWQKNPLTRDITIKTRNEFFSGHKIVDWTERVDLNKDVVITPIPFDYRYAIFEWGETSTQPAKQYREDKRNPYGAMKLDTGYEFDGSDKKLLEDTVIRNAVVSMEYDREFQNRNAAYRFRDDKTIPAIFEKDGTMRERCTDTMQLFFWNGWQDCLPYKFTDDDPTMAASGDFCWGGVNAQEMREYPQMTRVIKTGDSYWSLDFGKPDKLYYPATNEDYPSVNDGEGKGCTIYDRFWRAFMNERLNKDTRIMTCYIRITPAEYATWEFNTFVKIENTLWHVVKIHDFDPTKQQSTKVELVRVNDIQAYVNGQNLQ